MSEPPKLKSLLVVAPWLEGGGAQKSLCGLLRGLTDTHTTVVTLFCRLPRLQRGLRTSQTSSSCSTIQGVLADWSEPVVP